MTFAQQSRSIRYQFNLLAALAIGLFAAISTQASAQTLEVSGGILDGVDGVVVDGNSYNVAFVAGSCISVFNGCTSASDFTFQTAGSASDASIALGSILSGGIVNPSFPNGIVDAQPSALELQIITPNGISDSLVVGNYIDVRPSDVIGPFSFTNEPPSAVTSQSTETVYADWSTAPTAVPEPWTIMLFGAGLLGMGFIYRRRTVKLSQ